MRAFLKILGVCLLLLLLTALVGLVFLNISPGKKFVGKEIKKRMGMDVTYGRLLPRSLDTVRVSGVEVFSDGEVTVSEVEVDLDFVETLKTRKPVVEEIVLVRPHAEVKAETLLALLKSVMQKQMDPPDLAQKAPVKNEPASAPADESKKTPQPKPTSEKPPERKPRIRKSPPAPPEPRPHPKISIVDASAEVTYKRFSGKKIKLSGISLETSKKDLNTKGILSIGALEIPGETISLGLDIPLEIKNQRLTFPRKIYQVGELQLELGGNVNGRSPYPFQLEGAVRILKEIRLHHQVVRQLHVQLGEGELSFRSVGRLASPNSIICDLTSEGKQIALSFDKRGAHTFDNYKLEARLRNGQLTLPSYQLRSPELSFMGNGIATTSGKGNFVMRMVGSKEWERQYFLLSNGLALGKPAINMYEIETRDRYYKDFFLRLSPDSGLEYQFQNQEKWYPIDFLLGRLKTFTKQELKEEDERE